MGGNSMEKLIGKQKPKFKKGLWSPEEDERLRNYILRHGYDSWTSVPINAGLQRNGKSCRLRWLNYLRPGLKRGMFTPQEEEIILTLHHQLGNKWSQIAQHLPGRTDNEVKNFWHSQLKKKAAKIEKIESIFKAELTKANTHVAKHESQVTTSSTTTISSFHSSNEEGLSIDTNQSLGGHHQNFLPKLFFAEWLAMDDHDINNLNNNNIQGDPLQFCNNYNESEIESAQNMKYREGSCNSNEFCSRGKNNDIESLLNFDDRTQQNINEWVDLFYENCDILDDLFVNG